MKRLFKYHLIDNENHVIDESKKTEEDFIYESSITDGHYEGYLTANKDLKIESLFLLSDYHYDANDLIFVNGYQSWTDSFEYKVTDHLKNIYKAPRFLVDSYGFDRYGDAVFKNYQKHVLHGFDYSYIRGNKPLFIGSYNYNNAYLIINHYVRENVILFECDCKDLILKEGTKFKAFDFIMLEKPVEEAKDLFFGSYQNKKEKIFGYTSWYNHYQNINETIIIENLESISSEFNLFQIDDGFEEYVGDWLKIDKKKFPNGFERIVRLINDKNLIPGIWLAPFVAEEKSSLFKEHPEYFKRADNGAIVKCGGNWSGFYLLDIYNEEARNYIIKCLKYYKDLGFKFFKLDFLYAVNLGTYEGKTKAMVSSDAYKLLRDTLEDNLILGCGAIISNSIDNFDYLRIGPDVSLKFDDIWYMKFFHRERISTKVTLQNTIYRSMFNNHFFGNDPDVFLLRKDNIDLSEEQKNALATINALFGTVLMTSDDLNKYEQKEKDLLHKILMLNKEAKNVIFKRDKELIVINYELNEEKINLVYNPKKGVFING